MGSLLALSKSGHDLGVGVAGLPFSIRRLNIEVEVIKDYPLGYLGKSEVESGS